MMLIWIGMETFWLGYVSFLQPVIAGYSLAIVLLALLPPVRRYYRA
jgi:hypothetical protein